ncbi:hypothetical protein CEXT_731271 [Caerostris extrusa]|uniref:Uncharacterized protein n=1 Tax=Caerostris extrusa TaxID=172846 RepID=A0AAV4X744_CAEEX|nr:hypothetical protein CEXT_731271 [Caerostris extrusa]
MHRDRRKLFAQNSFQVVFSTGKPFRLEDESIVERAWLEDKIMLKTCVLNRDVIAIGVYLQLVEGEGEGVVLPLPPSLSWKTCTETEENYLHKNSFQVVFSTGKPLRLGEESIVERGWLEDKIMLKTCVLNRDVIAIGVYLQLLEGEGDELCFPPTPPFLSDELLRQRMKLQFYVYIEAGVLQIFATVCFLLISKAEYFGKKPANASRSCYQGSFNFETRRLIQLRDVRRALNPYKCRLELKMSQQEKAKVN